MSVRITSTENVVALFDSVSGWAFGPTFESEDAAQDFLETAESENAPDLSTISNDELERFYNFWLAVWTHNQ